MTLIYLPHYNLSIWKPTSFVTLEEITDELDQFVQIERNNPSFNRFSNISETDFSNIKFEEVRQIYLRRIAEYKGPAVKSVFYIKTDLQYGVARMYQTLMTDTPIKVEIYKAPEECANYLNVPTEILLNQS